MAGALATGGANAGATVALAAAGGVSATAALAAGGGVSATAALAAGGAAGGGGVLLAVACSVCWSFQVTRRRIPLGSALPTSSAGSCAG